MAYALLGLLGLANEYFVQRRQFNAVNIGVGMINCCGASRLTAISVMRPMPS